jgi:DNA-3-methyladenine glycosylase I
MTRCPWSTSNELYICYHDEEWGFPVFDDQKQFEFLVLESAQAGLSWNTILNKRENYRAAYDGFDVQEVAEYDEIKIAELMQNAGIIRNRRKIEASINNAKCFIEIQKEFDSFCNYLWDFVGGKPLVNHWTEISQIPARTELSDRISKDMKKRGFKFLGSIIIYSHLQATGLVNDHIVSCFRWKECQL